MTNGGDFEFLDSPFMRFLDGVVAFAVNRTVSFIGLLLGTPFLVGALIGGLIDHFLL
jgi:hypothetical protein